MAQLIITRSSRHIIPSQLPQRMQFDTRERTICLHCYSGDFSITTSSTLITIIFGNNCLWSLKNRNSVSIQGLRNLLFQKKKKMQLEALGSECLEWRTPVPLFSQTYTELTTALCSRRFSGWTSHQLQAYLRSEENIFSFLTQLSNFQKPSILRAPSGENVL